MAIDISGIINKQRGEKWTAANSNLLISAVVEAQYNIGTLIGSESSTNIALGTQHTGKYYSYNSSTVTLTDGTGIYYDGIDISMYDTIILEYSGAGSGGRAVVFADSNDNKIIAYKESENVGGVLSITQKVEGGICSIYISTGTSATITTFKGINTTKGEIKEINESIEQNALEVEQVRKSSIETKKELVLSALNKVGLDVRYIRGLVGRVFGKLSLNAAFDNLPLKSLLWDGYSVVPILYDVPEFTNDVYVSPDAPNSGRTGTKESPKSLYSVMSNISSYNGYNIHLSAGAYFNKKTNDLIQNTSVRFICDDGRAIIVGSSKIYTFSKADGYTNLYAATRSNYDIEKVVALYDNEYMVLEEVESINLCESTTMSYYVTENTIYVNSVGCDVFVCEKIASTIISFRNSGSTQHKLYCENIDFIGGYGIDIGGSTSGVDDYSTYAQFNECSFIAPYDYNCINAKHNSNVVLVGCVAKYSTADGLNYHNNCNFVEINCQSGCHGYDNNVQANSNASTSHNDCIGLRVNGVYYNTFGPVVADVNSAITCNFNCVALEGRNTNNTAGGFLVDTATMYCVLCDTDAVDYSYKVSDKTQGVIYNKLSHASAIDESTPLE